MGARADGIESVRAFADGKIANHYYLAGPTCRLSELTAWSSLVRKPVASLLERRKVQVVSHRDNGLPTSLRRFGSNVSSSHRATWRSGCKPTTAEQV